MGVIGNVSIVNKKNTVTIAIVAVILIFSFVPWMFYTNLPVLSIIIGIVAVWMAYNKKIGYSFIFIALSFTIPYSPSLEKDIIADYIWWPINAIRESIFLIFILYYVIRKMYAKLITKHLLIILSSLLILSFLYSIYNNSNFLELINWINTAFYFILFYFITYNDQSSLKDFLLLLDILFICTSIYTIIEFIFQISPYQSLYSQYITFGIEDEIGRAKGLLGHPLVLSSLVIIYQVTLYIRLMLFKEFKALLFALTLVIGVFTTSRTTVVIMAFSFIYYFIAAGIYKNPKKIIVIIFIITITIFAALNSLQYYINNNLNRIETSSSEHRMAGYTSVANFSADHILGVGYTDLTKKIKVEGYASKGLIDGFGTLDNFFLTQIAAYGIFSIIVFAFYFYLFFKSYHYRKKNKMLFRSAFMLFLTWCLIGLSFNLESYLCLLLLFSGLYAKLNKQYLIEKIEHKESLLKNNNYAINHYC
ncbi:O-antigen ligase family protein [uncultured Acetobacteroides sp.]|uniref:O-antigen ligase family protein n=1 Tax=uncultured Acetobacteroides sp. TaxID=1760811 RepID=UPI0029F4F860|nr:O-antigen ligase family protein [uncultured Acetobacteroides sp.]